MAKFKVGDRVRRVTRSTWPKDFGHLGQEYTIQGFKGDHLVIFDGCDGASPDAFELIPTITVEPGKHYRLRNGKVTGRISHGDIGFEALVDGQVKVFDKAGGHVFGNGEMDIVEAWVPKVGERVRYSGKCETYNQPELIGIEGGVKDTYESSSGDLLVNVAWDVETSNGSFTGGAKYLENIEPLLVAAPAQPAVLKIEAGKFYKTRDGRKVGPMSSVPWGGFYDDSRAITSQRWEESGSFIKGRTSNVDIIAEWIDEPAGVTASNDNAAPAKFKVGDQVVAVGDENDFGTVTKYADGLYAVAWSSHGSRPHDDLIWDEDELVAAPALAAIVALIEDGVAKPSSKPKVHSSQADATAEAERLALAHPGQLFGVFVLADSKIADVVNVPTPVLRAA